MKKPLIGYILLSLFAFMLIYNETYPRDIVTELEALPVFAGLASMAAMLIWMSINLLLNWKKIKYPVLWVLFFFFGNWIAAIVYFIFAFQPVEKGPILKRKDEPPLYKNRRGITMNRVKQFILQIPSNDE